MTDVIVIGAGLAGLTAAAHAVRAGASVRLIAQGWGHQLVAPGWISVWDRDERAPLTTAQHVGATCPDHPYALAGADAVRAGLDAFTALAESVGLPHVSGPESRSLRLPTLLGAIQTPALAPRGLAQGDLGNGPMLIVGLRGWRDFFPALMAAGLAAQGYTARALTIDLPTESGSWDAWPGDLAHRFEDAAFRQDVIRQVKPHLQGAAKVGFPAVLGLDHHMAVIEDLERGLGCPVFEIATLPPSVPGTRLSHALRRWLLRQRARVQIGHPVLRGLVEGDRCVGVDVGALGHTNTFRADRVILATGGVYNGGLQTDMAGRVWEPLFNLPVSAPPGEDRSGWMADHALSAEAHPVLRAGLRVNSAMQPLDESGSPALANVFAAGQIIAGVDPLVDGCVEGVAMVTAWRATQSALEQQV